MEMPLLCITILITINKEKKKPGVGRKCNKNKELAELVRRIDRFPRGVPEKYLAIGYL
jgi:hypothetical protein